MLNFLQNVNPIKRPDQAPKEYQRAAAHLIPSSVWPFFTSLSLAVFLFGTVFFFHFKSSGIYIMFFGLFTLIFCLFNWFRDILTEADIFGSHTQLVQKALRFGMFLFIVSEVMFFVSFFWAFFHFSLSPSVTLFCIWPPVGISVLDPWGIPFLNTIILLSSGVTLTFAHRSILAGDNKKAYHGLFWTILYGFIFTFCQLFEYITCPFSINDSVYGSIFFMSTGFHGLHVIVGTIFLIVCFVRLRNRSGEENLSFTPERHLGFECAAYYWHFVDVVWLFLFVSIYWWGS